jgi:aspartate ammonia-lyase
MKTFNLNPVNGRKSFYGKAIVIEENGISKLKSYDKIVAEYNHDDNYMKVYAYHSITTLTHINSFLDYYGFDTCTKKELENNYLKN